MNEQQGPVQNQRRAFWQAMGFAWDFGIIVVVPLVALGVLGRYLDRRFSTSPWLLLSGAILAIIISTALVVVRLKAIISKATNQKQ